MNSSCKQNGCQVALSGKCLEGFEDLQECPHIQMAVNTESEQFGEITDEPVTAQFDEDLDAPREKEEADLMLPPGEALTYEQTSEVLRSGNVRIVVLIGLAWSGKTTLLARIYEQFEKQEFAGFKFAGSRSLLDFSRRSWLASCNSGRLAPDTERTKKWESERFLHLRVGKPPGPSRDMLFADISGETYQEATRSLEACRRLSILQRADHLTLFLDCARLKDLENRNFMLSKTKTFLKMALQEELIGAGSTISLVLSKWDSLLPEKDHRDCLSFLDSSVEELRTILSGVASVEVFKTAARPNMGVPIEIEQNLGNLFCRWEGTTNRGSWRAEFEAVDLSGCRPMLRYSKSKKF